MRTKQHNVAQAQAVWAHRTSLDSLARVLAEEINGRQLTRARSGPAGRRAAAREQSDHRRAGHAEQLAGHRQLQLQDLNSSSSHLATGGDPHFPSSPPLHPT